MCSENKGADQLRGYREADLRLCFHICKKPVFSQRGSYEIHIQRKWLNIRIYIRNNIPLLQMVKFPWDISVQMTQMPVNNIPSVHHLLHDRTLSHGA